MNESEWTVGQLKLSPSLVCKMAINSLKIRLSRTFLTVLTVAVSTAFLVYVFTLPAQQDRAELENWYLMMALCLLVATVGVLNTMLMSVTQRYREIGTMKCLGALDSFVLYSVLFESALVGLIGATLGVLGGLAISILLGALEFGGNVFQEMSFNGLGWKLGLTFLAGVFLTTFGAAIPSWIAAKMPPMEAMRGEK